MQIISSMSNSNSKLEKIDNKISFFNYISLSGIAVTLISGLFLIIYNDNGTKIRNQKNNELSDSLNKANIQIATLNEKTIIQTNNLVETQFKLTSTQLKLEDTRRDVENDKKTNFELSLNLEKERQKTILMQQNLAPRELEQAESSSKLKQFGTYNVIIRYVPDFEAYRFTGMVNTMATMAGWKFQYEQTKFNEIVSDGVSIDAHDYPLMDTTLFKDNPIMLEMIKSHHTYNVIDQLLDIFKENKIDAAYRVGGHDLPPDTIIITIGLRPNKFESGVKANTKNNRTY